LQRSTNSKWVCVASIGIPIDCFKCGVQAVPIASVSK
jgi:hypothetical protein